MLPAPSLVRPHATTTVTVRPPAITQRRRLITTGTEDLTLRDDASVLRQQLQLSEATKLGLRDHIQAVVFAFTTGLVTPSDESW